MARVKSNPFGTHILREIPFATAAFNHLPAFNRLPRAVSRGVTISRPSGPAFISAGR
jgi:hypothetical protein